MSAQLRLCHTTAKDPPGIKYLQKVKRGITAAATKWDVNLDPKLEAQLSSGKYKCEGQKSTRFGNRPIEESTKLNYENSFQQLWRFCVIKGDYENTRSCVKIAVPFSRETGTRAACSIMIDHFCTARVIPLHTLST
jgi:hypothetical protein